MSDEKPAENGAEAPKSPAVVKKAASTVAKPKSPAPPAASGNSPENNPEITPAAGKSSPEKAPEIRPENPENANDNVFSIFGW